MSDHMELEHSGLQEVANAMREQSALEGVLSGSKRKRESESGDDIKHDMKRVSPNHPNNDLSDALQDYNNLHQHGANDNSNGTDHGNAPQTAAAALAGIYPTLSIPQPTDVSFAAQAAEHDRNNPDSSFLGDSQADSFLGETSQTQSSGAGGRNNGSKPAVGSDEWHKVRKDNHKEVERRRRETINEGINELQKIVPGCEKNKGSILQRSVQFIIQLKENETQNIEKWTLEKLLTEQAIAELSASNDKLKLECARAWRESETWKKVCQNAGLAPTGDEASET